MELRMAQCCVELHYGNVLGSYHTSFGCYEIARKLGHNSSAKTLPLLQFDTTPIQSQAQPKNGRYTSSILTVQALRVISINFLLAMSVHYKTEWLRELFKQLITQDGFN